jgi:ribokinase
MTKFDVVGFGALNVDKLYKVNRIAGKEEESFVVEYKESCGGSAANTIAGLARLGLKTGYVGKVADDHEGNLLLGDFKTESVDTNGIIIAKSGQSGVVMGFVDKKGERALYVAPGVNDTIDLKEVSRDYVKQTKLLHITSFVGEKSFKSQKELVKQLPANVRVSFDPGMLYAKKGLSALRPIIERAFAMFPNETELKLLTGKKYEEGGVKTLLANGVKVVGIKLGEKGCFVSNGEESYVIEPFKVEVIDTTGAGDAWNAGFLYGLLKNESLLECGRLGNLVASKCVTKIGARTGLPQLDDLY